MNMPEVMAIKDDNDAMKKIVQLSKGVHRDKHKSRRLTRVVSKRLTWVNPLNRKWTRCLRGAIR